MTALKRPFDIHATLAIQRTQQVRREEYLDHMTFRANLRPLFTEIFGPLLGVKEEWAAQGATPEELGMAAFRYRQAVDGAIPVQTGWLGGEEEAVLEETDSYRITRDRMGRRMKLSKRAATLPLPMDYPVRNMDDWRRIESRYAFSEARFGAHWEAAARAHREAGRVVTVGIPGGFDEPRQLMGEEALCIAAYEQPELIHAMLTTIGETAFRALERVSAAAQIDQLFVHEDMAGKNGPLFGPRQVTEFIQPYYRRVWDMLQERGARLFKQDSDGDMTPIIPAMLDAGINLMFPVEPTGKQDIVRLREKFGTRLAFLGGIDKHVLCRSKAEIAAELEYRLPPLIRTGGCMMGLDHRILNGTSLDNYRFYVQKAWEIMERDFNAETRRKEEA